MPVQNFFFWDFELFLKRIGLLRNTSQNFKGIFLGTGFFKTARSIIPTIFISFRLNFSKMNFLHEWRCSIEYEISKFIKNEQK